MHIAVFSLLLLGTLALAGCADDAPRAPADPEPNDDIPRGPGFLQAGQGGNTTDDARPGDAPAPAAWWASLPAVIVAGKAEVALTLPWGGVHAIRMDVTEDVRLMSFPHPYEATTADRADEIQYGFAVVPAAPLACTPGSGFAMDVASGHSGYFSSASGEAEVPLPAGTYIVLAWRWAAYDGEPTTVPGPFRLHIDGGGSEATMTTATEIMATDLPERVSFAQEGSGDVILDWTSDLAFVLPSISLGFDVVENEWSYDMQRGGGCPGQADSGTYTAFVNEDYPDPDPWNGVALDGFEMSWSFSPPAANPLADPEMRLDALLLHGVPPG